ncbi:MAG: hypothetical protein LBC70_10765 [Chitinispirillales bacterium]|nr:hypothetical protein [Chitinispirillales bacterium]
MISVKKILLRTRRFLNTAERAWNNDEMEMQNRLGEPVRLERFGYKVFSQNDEDGIIEEIFNRIGVTDKRFVEFGVENGLESNGHFLLHKGWSGLWIEGSKKHCKTIQKLFRKPIEQKRLTAVNAFITAESINGIIAGWKGDAGGGIDLLSIDIDGNDYHIWNAIKCISPRVVIVEYNSKFPPTYEWVMPYNADYVRNYGILKGGSDCFGASLKSFEILGGKLGYQLVGTNLNGVNAFFVKKELAQNLFALPASAENMYNPPRHNIAYGSRHASSAYIG